MEKYKLDFLESIVKADYMEGNEERLYSVRADDENAFTLVFESKTEEGLKGIKLKAGYQFNGETQSRTVDTPSEGNGDTLIPMGDRLYQKILFVKMTGAKRGKTLLEMNKKFGTSNTVVEVKGGNVTEPPKETRSVSVIMPTAEKKETVDDGEDLHIEIPEEAIEIDDKPFVKDAEPTVHKDIDELPIVKPSLGQEWKEATPQQVSEELNEAIDEVAKQSREQQKAKKDIKVEPLQGNEREEEVSKVKADFVEVDEASAITVDKNPPEMTEGWLDAIGDREEAFGKVRGFMYKFIYAIGEIKSVKDFVKFLDTMNEEHSDHLQIMMKTGSVQFKDEYKKAFYDYAKKQEWGIVAWVDAPTYGDLKSRAESKELADEKARELELSPRTESGEIAEPLMRKQTKAEEPKKEKLEETVSVEQKPDTAVKTNFEDEDYEALNPHGRISDVKKSMTRCSGFLPRSSVNISPDGDFEERW